ncbi:F-box domain containing protein [Tanacetum coccineum]
MINTSMSMFCPMPKDFNAIRKLTELLRLPLLPAFHEASNSRERMVHGVSYAAAAAEILDDTGRNSLPSSFLVGNVIKFKSLKLLKHKYVTIDDNMIKHLTTGCPLLEELFFFAFGVERIDIEAPNLCYLKLFSRCGRPPCLNVASCKKLTTVCYCGDPSPTRKGLADFSADFPYLKTLFLHLPDICDSLKLSIKRDSVSSKSRMECHPLGFVEALWFKKLRRFLDKNVRFKELKLCITTLPYKVEELRMIQSLPLELDHVDLEPDIIRPRSRSLTLGSAYLAVVDGVLWCCRPRSLTLESGFSSIHFEEWSYIVNFTYEKLLIQEDQGQTNVRIVTSSSSNAKEHFSDLTSLLMALPRDGLRPIITFIKEQVQLESSPSRAQACSLELKHVEIDC